MAELSAFASQLLEESKHFLEKAGSTTDSDSKQAYTHAALMVGFAAFEAHVNAMADDFLSRADLTPHERGFLGEHAVEIIDGEFREKNVLKIQRVEDRVLFLCRRFSKKPVDRGAAYWSNFVEATRLRNSLTHPKAGMSAIGEVSVKRALTAIVEMLNFMFMSIYKKELPAYKRALISRLTF